MIKNRRVKMNFIEILIRISIVLLMLSLFAFPDNDFFAYASRVLVIVLIGIDGMKHIKLSWYILWGIIYFGLSIASVLWASDTLIALNDSIKILQLILVSILISTWLDHTEKLQFIIKMIIFCSLIMVFRVYYEVPFSYWGVRRFSSVLGLNVNTIAIRLTLTAILLVHLIHNSMLKSKVFYMGIFLVITSQILLIGSRRSILILIFCSSIYMIMTSTSVVRTIKAIVLSLIFGWTIIYAIQNVPQLYTIVGQRFVTMIEAVANQEPIDQSRNELIMEGLEMFSKKPFLGWGVGNYSVVSGMDRYSHNNYIEILSTIGIVGLIVYYSVHFIIMFNLLRRKKSPYDALFICIIIGVLLSDIAAPSYASLFMHIFIAFAVAYMKNIRVADIKLNATTKRQLNHKVIPDILVGDDAYLKRI